MSRLLVGAIVAPLLLAAAGVSDPGSAGIVSVFESGGVSEATLSAIAELGGDRDVLAMDRGTFRMMSVSRDGRPVQTFDPGFGVPMSVSAFDPAEAEGFVAPEVLAGVIPGSVVMSERSAALRGATVGDAILLEGWNGSPVSLTVSAVLPDDLLDWQELIVHPLTASDLGFDRIGSVEFVGSDRDAAMLRQKLSEFPVRISGPGEEVDRTDFVLPTIAVKERFGEFSFRPSRGDAIEIDDAWVEENIVTVDVPSLGEFKCHRKVVPYIRSALEDLQRRGLISEIDSADFQLAGGCWNARLIRGGDKGFALSRHAWGIAIDINPSTNRYEGPVSLSEGFGDTFRDWGFAWGAGWLRPDGMHFEWTEPAFPAESRCSTLSLVPSPIPTVDWRIVERTIPCR